MLAVADIVVSSIRQGWSDITISSTEEVARRILNESSPADLGNLKKELLSEIGKF